MKSRGFTLIELSIVLVIIALLIGGLLSGKALIQSASIRQTISQLEGYSIAVYAFRNKYGGLPGDFLYTRAQAFGFFTFGATCNFSAGAGTLACGDGNGKIERAAIAFGTTEHLVFWRHLSDANLIETSYGSIGNSALTPAGIVTASTTQVNQSIPAAAMGGGNYIIAYTILGVHYFQILPIERVATNGYISPAVGGISPSQAFAIDVKTDDGQPNTGTAIAMVIAPDQQPASWLSTPTNGFCLTGGVAAADTTARYNLDVNNGGDTASCSIRLRMN